MAGLQFSDTTTRQGLIQDCEDNLSFPATGISGTTALLQQFTRYMNIWYHKTLTMILQSQDSWDFDDASLNSNSPIATRALVSGQRDYSFSTALWNLVSKEGGTQNPTITLASPGVFTLANHGLNINDAVRFTTTGSLPTGLTAGTTYYVISAGLGANTFQVSATLGGAAVNTSVSQSGTHSMTRLILPLRIKRVDISYDRSTWYKARLFDTGISSIGLGNDTNTDGQFSKTSPQYDLADSGVSVYPTASAADVTSGALIRIEFSRDIVEFLTSDTIKTPVFDVPFHRILSVGASYDYAAIKSLPVANAMAGLLQDFEMRIKQHYGQKDTDTQFIVRAEYINYN